MAFQTLVSKDLPLNGAKAAMLLVSQDIPIHENPQGRGQRLGIPQLVEHIETQN